MSKPQDWADTLGAFETDDLEEPTGEHPPLDVEALFAAVDADTLNRIVFPAGPPLVSHMLDDRDFWALLKRRGLGGLAVETVRAVMIVWLTKHQTKRQP